MQVLQSECPGRESNPGLHSGMRHARKEPVEQLFINYSDIYIWARDSFSFLETSLRIRIMQQKTILEQFLFEWNLWSIRLKKSTQILSSNVRTWSI
jgi:hypothetical protein